MKRNKIRGKQILEISIIMICSVILAAIIIFVIKSINKLPQDKTNNVNHKSYNYVDIDDSYTSENIYKVQMYYNDTYPESECVFTEKQVEEDDSVMIYEDENGSPGAMIGIYSLIDKLVENETTYSKEGIYIGFHESYNNSKPVWIQFIKCKG